MRRERKNMDEEEDQLVGLSKQMNEKEFISKQEKANERLTSYSESQIGEINENGRRERGRRGRGRRRREEAENWRTNVKVRYETKKVMLLFSAAYCLLAILIGSQLQLGHSTVVRPTIFSGLNSQDSPQQQQQNPQTQLSNSQQSNHQNPAADVPQTPPSTKISPFKSRFCTALSGARLDAPLGLNSLQVDDFALSASSYSNEQVGPHLARLNLDVAGGAWCPVKPISNSNFGKEWIQVKLNRSFVVTAIETQGRFGMGSGKEFVPSYQIEYSRNGGLSWHRWKDFRGSSTLRGNEDTNSAVKNELSPPIVGANVIRILPYSQHLRTVCLRFELYGCQYDEGAPIAYATNDGVVEPRWGHLIDYTYDGLRQRGLLSQGLGQLVDGVKGPDNFSLNSGFEWVGWKSMNGDVIIEFTFKTLRNFTGALFHSNNLFSSGVEVFQAVDVHYGIDVHLSGDILRDSIWEQQRRRLKAPTAASQLQQPNGEVAPSSGSQHILWSPDVLSIEYEPDKKVESSRPVTVHLKQRLANKLRFVLKFASKWILVSEVEFLSHPVELLSLSSISESHTPELLNALAPTKSYDEYVAILREHQLRRIATNAYLESFQVGGSSSLAPPPASGESTSADQPPVPEVAETTSGQNVWQTQQQQQDFASSSSAPSTNPILSNQPFANQPSHLPAANLNAYQQLDFPSVVNANQLPAVAILGQSIDSTGKLLIQQTLDQQQQQQQQPTSHSNSSGGQRRTLGLATVISLVLVSILIALSLLWAVSSYRLRQQPKLNSASHHHLTGGKGMLANHPNLHNFMSVFSSGQQQQHQHQHLQASQLAGQAFGYSPAESADQQQHTYNSIFANPIEAAAQRADSLRTLRRLATLTTGARKSSGQSLLGLQQQQQQLNGNQLLVSVKDSPPGAHHHQLFGGGGGSGAAGKQAISTQLIVGLNQVNPLAQQQIYNNSSGMNCSNQTYATHYSTSMSMASSSTTGHQGDSADYAIPDAQAPIIPPLLPQRQQFLQGSQQQMHSLPANQHNHNQHPHNHTNIQSHHYHQLNQVPTAANVKLEFGYQTELRSSHHRLANHNSNTNGQYPQATLIHPQVIHQSKG